jgi:hypothetical protein
LFDLGVADLGSGQRRHLAETLPHDLDEFCQFFLEGHERRSLAAAGFGTVTLFADARVWRFGIVGGTRTILSSVRRCGEHVHTEACHEHPAARRRHERFHGSQR